jgi:hypothetical protein
MAAAREAYIAAMAAASSAQSDAQRFIRDEYGPDVLSGHSDVGMVEAHNIGADPDTFGPDAADD